MPGRSADDGIQGQGSTGRALKRRGILAAAGAVVAGIVAKQASVPVAAAANMQFADTTTPVTNTVAGETRMTGALPVGTSLLVVDASPSQGSGANGIVGRGSLYGGGVVGVTHGVTLSPGDYNTGSGVLAIGDANTLSTMVAISHAPIGNALYALNDSDNVSGYFVGRVGVVAQAYSPNNDPNTVGLVGEGGTYVGIIGRSSGNHGIVGTTTAGGYGGVTGVTGSPQVAAIAGTATVPTAYAGYFTGTTIVQGDFVAFGGVKSAAVKDASGQHRLVYCVESPESWFEDFGKGTLVSGKAEVRLDPVFTQIAHTDDYHVFLTEYDDHNLLYVTKRTAAGFAVQAKSGAPNGSFSYRVVAKRADIRGERLAKFDLPKINIPDESKLPKSEPPKAVPSPLPPTRP